MRNPSRTIPMTPVAVEAAQRIHARSANGVFAHWRLALVILTQLFFYGVPWITIDGRQAVLFDLAHQRFYLFNTLLLPQDLIFLTGLLIACAMALFLVTVAVGRIWCGFACPQTVYTEMFMALERRIEGDRSARLRLDQSGWGPNKVVRRGGKHLAWALLSLWTGLSFVGWFTPIRELVHGLPFDMGPWNTFWMLLYAAITYLHAGLLRERICQHACPYGRFQSAMLDRDTLVVTYDQARGGPRGRHRAAHAEPVAAFAGAVASPATAAATASAAVAAASAEPKLGDCIDCTMCVQVCPTGIDIRKGLQAACISCGVCIDACNSIMDKIKAPRGLIRFSPLNPDSPTRGAPWRKPRLWVYGGVITAVVTLMIAGLMTRPDLRLDVQRDRGVLARMAPNGDVENLYRLQIRSATLHPQHLDIQVKVDGTPVPARLITAHNDAPPELDAAGSLSLPVTVSLPYEGAQALRGQTVPLRFEVRGTDKGTSEVLASSTFRVPR